MHAGSSLGKSGLIRGSSAAASFGHQESAAELPRKAFNQPQPEGAGAQHGAEGFVTGAAVAANVDLPQDLCDPLITAALSLFWRGRKFDKGLIVG